MTMTREDYELGNASCAKITDAANGLLSLAGVLDDVILRYAASASQLERRIQELQRTVNEKNEALVKLEAENFDLRQQLTPKVLLALVPQEKVS